MIEKTNANNNNSNNNKTITITITYKLEVLKGLYYISPCVYVCVCVCMCVCVCVCVYASPRTKTIPPLASNTTLLP